MKETLPKFLKAFSLTTLNPLRDITILEKPHLNQFVHPIMDSALWIFAKVYYIYGEIPLKGMKTKVRADGVGFLNDVINYPIVCGEGARPGASQQKSVDDDVKNAKSMVELYNNIVISEADAHRQLFTDLKTYGITAFKTEVSLTMMDFRSTHRLFEVDNFGLPRDWADMPNFVWLYEAVIKWALCANATRGALIDHRKKRRLELFSQSTSDSENDKLASVSYDYDTRSVSYEAYLSAKATIAENTMPSAPKFKPACISVTSGNQEMIPPTSYQSSNCKSDTGEIFISSRYAKQPKGTALRLRDGTLIMIV
ncbi:hypothetical protein GLOIN_2v1646421 [Rhizophagus irregularis DAOM 181602=DAOM 197198]|nr:hypothetical protein GLOIN_2v1646421 [Rhizophagus irregularis DAOM 181602=DAOM 197198]